jgi:3-phosphoshikimate 1-carboxyvinyltransferase
MQVADAIEITPARGVRGRIRVPGDKSISHRYALLAALAGGRSTLDNYAPGADCASTLSCLSALGVHVTRGAVTAQGPGPIRIDGRGLRGLQASGAALDCGNSGSTMRMLAGVVAAHDFTSTLAGDPSLSRRPMRRVIAPLALMGARLDSGPDGRPPLVVRGGRLHGIDFTPEVASAQVKSAVLLAGLQAGGRTRVTEPASTRDHTERALAAFGAEVRIEARTVVLSGGQVLEGRVLRIPGDISSAAFPAVAAAALPGSEIVIEDVGLNPTRTALVDVLRRFGADVEVTVQDEWQGEPVGAIRVRHGATGDVVIAPEEVPEIIDELPVLAALATAGGSVSVSGAGELRVKESDRISALVQGLRALGGDADERPDGFTVRGTRRLTGGTADAQGDHRLAMAFAIAGLGAAGRSWIAGAGAVAVSYPGFFDDLARLRA